MKFRELPLEIAIVLRDLSASPRLVAHLILVHDVAITLVEKLTEQWPCLMFDAKAVSIGAASHDIGKAIVPNEVTGTGNRHEMIGFQLLVEKGIPEHYARFASTHGRWASKDYQQLEDLLVALADKVWKGARVDELEHVIAKAIADVCHEEQWHTYMKLDDIVSAIALDADARSAWQTQHGLG